MYIRQLAQGVPVWIGGFKNNYGRWQWKNGDLWKYEERKKTSDIIFET